MRQARDGRVMEKFPHFHNPSSGEFMERTQGTKGFNWSIKTFSRAEGFGGPGVSGGGISLRTLQISAVFGLIH